MVDDLSQRSAAPPQLALTFQEPAYLVNLLARMDVRLNRELIVVEAREAMKRRNDAVDICWASHFPARSHCLNQIAQDV